MDSVRVRLIVTKVTEIQKNLQVQMDSVRVRLIVTKVTEIQKKP